MQTVSSIHLLQPFYIEFNMYVSIDKSVHSDEAAHINLFMRTPTDTSRANNVFKR